MAKSYGPLAPFGQWNSAEAAKSVNQWRHTFGLRESHFYPAGAQLFCAGAPVYDIFLLTRGIAGLYYALEINDETLFMLGYPGHLVDACTLEPGSVSPISGIALTPCETYRLRLEELRDAARRDPAVAVLLQGSLQTQLSRRTAALAELLTLAPTERLAHHLCELSRVMNAQLGGHVAGFALPLTDDHLAMLLGVSLRQFKRIKKDIQRKLRVRPKEQAVASRVS